MELEVWEEDRKAVQELLLALELRIKAISVCNSPPCVLEAYQYFSFRNAELCDVLIWRADICSKYSERLQALLEICKLRVCMLICTVPLFLQGSRIAFL